MVDERLRQARCFPDVSERFNIVRQYNTHREASVSNLKEIVNLIQHKYKYNNVSKLIKVYSNYLAIHRCGLMLYVEYS